MTDVPSDIVETKRVDAQTLVKRLFKVAELLSRHSAKMDDFLDKNGHQKRAPQEIEYCETSDPFNDT